MDHNNESAVIKIERARAQLNNALEKLAPQEEIYPTWKLKQLMDHITGWDELVYITLKHYFNNENPSIKVKGGIDSFNFESVSKRKDISFEQSRQDYDAARKKVLQLLREIPPEMMGKKFPAPWGGNCSVNAMVKIFVSHELEHARHIEAFLAGAS